MFRRKIDYYHGLLEEAGVSFALNSRGASPKRSQTATHVLSLVNTVRGAFSDPFDRQTQALIEGGNELDSIYVRINDDILLHGLSKLIENAIKAARECQGGCVQIDVAATFDGLQISIGNSAKGIDIERLGLALGGDPLPFRIEVPPKVPERRIPLGMKEARACFDELAIRREVTSGIKPIAVVVKLFLRADAPNGKGGT